MSDTPASPATLDVGQLIGNGIPDHVQFGDIRNWRMFGKIQFIKAENVALYRIHGRNTLRAQPGGHEFDHR